MGGRVLKEIYRCHPRGQLTTSNLLTFCFFGAETFERSDETTEQPLSKTPIRIMPSKSRSSPLTNGKTYLPRYDSREMFGLSRAALR